MGNGFRRGWAVAGLVAGFVFVGCGDPETDDDRGFYTKAPLEDATFFVDGEEPSVVSELGEPILIPRVLPDGRLAGPDEQEDAQPAQAQPEQGQAGQGGAAPAAPAAAPADTAAA